MTWLVYDVYSGEKPKMSHAIQWASTIAPDAPHVGRSWRHPTPPSNLEVPWRRGPGERWVTPGHRLLPMPRICATCRNMHGILGRVWTRWRAAANVCRLSIYLGGASSSSLRLWWCSTALQSFPLAPYHVPTLAVSIYLSLVRGSRDL